MNTGFRFRVAIAAALFLLSAFSLLATPSQAAPITFDPSGEDGTSPVLVLPSVAGSTLNFSLVFASPYTGGNFSFDVYGAPGKAAGDWLGSISFFLLTWSDPDPSLDNPLPAGPANFGSINIPGGPGPWNEYYYPAWLSPNPDPQVADPSQTNNWSFSVNGTGDLYFYVTSGLSLTDGSTVPVTADLTYTESSPNVVPLPGALPLFAAGLGVFGLVARRRQKKSTLAT